MKCTVFEQFSRNKGTYLVVIILKGIKNGRWAEVINQLQRALADGETEKAERLKKSLPGFTVSATYTGARKKDFFDEYSGILILDIDKVDPVLIDLLLEKIRKAPYTVFCFVSPSGRGIKIGVCPVTRFALTMENHTRNFRVAADWYEAWLGVPVDPSGKDIGRLCFVSFDPELYIATRFLPFLQGEGDLPDDLPFMELVDKHVEAGRETAGEDSPEEIGKKITTARGQTTKRMRYEPGNRNNYVYTFALYCKRKDIPLDHTLSYCFRSFSDMNEQEVRQTVNSAYGNSNEQHTEKEREIADARCARLMEAIKGFIRRNYLLRLNIVTNRIEYIRVGSVLPFTSMTDLEENSLWCALQEAGINCTLNNLRAVVKSDFSPPFDPFVDYFRSLPAWDGKTDFIGQFADTVQTSDQELWQMCFRKWLVAMVACAIDPTVENHTVLVLNSAQGTGKTTWCCNLVPPELRDYRYSGLSDTRLKDTQVALSECILINFDELGTLSIKDINKLKELITKGVIRERRSYGYNADTMIRRASFTASVNSSSVLTDITGSRRFLCFDVKTIDYMRPVDYAGVFSQALSLFDTGFRFWFDKEEIDRVNENNEDFRVRSAEEEFLYTYIRKPEEDSQVGVEYLSASQILQHLCMKTSLQLTQGGIVLIGMLLKKENFKCRKKNNKNLFAVILVPAEQVEADKKSCPILPDKTDENDKKAGGQEELTF